MPSSRLPARLAAHELLQRAHGRGDFRCPSIPKSEDERLTRVQAFPSIAFGADSEPPRPRRGRPISSRSFRSTSDRAGAATSRRQRRGRARRPRAAGSPSRALHRVTTSSSLGRGPGSALCGDPGGLRKGSRQAAPRAFEKRDFEGVLGDGVALSGQLVAGSIRGSGGT